MLFCFLIRKMLFHYHRIPWRMNLRWKNPRKDRELSLYPYVDLLTYAEKVRLSWFKWPWWWSLVYNYCALLRAYGTGRKVTCLTSHQKSSSSRTPSLWRDVRDGSATESSCEPAVAKPLRLQIENKLTGHISVVDTFDSTTTWCWRHKSLLFLDWCDHVPFTTLRDLVLC